MLKSKYLHTKNGKKYKVDGFSYKKYKNKKNIDMFSTLPIRIPIKKNSYYININWNPLFLLLQSRLNCDWNDIYSEIISKCKKKFRHELENIINTCVHFPIYGDDYLPKNRKGFILEHYFFIDLNNKLCKKSKDDLLQESKRLKRKEKISKIYNKFLIS